MYLRLEKLNLNNKKGINNTQAGLSNIILPSISTSKQINHRHFASNQNNSHFFRVDRNILMKSHFDINRNQINSIQHTNRELEKKRRRIYQKSTGSLNLSSKLISPLSNKNENNQPQTINIIFSKNFSKPSNNLQPKEKNNDMFLTKIGFDYQKPVKITKGNDIKELLKQIELTKEQISKEQIDLRNIIQSTKDTHESINYISKYKGKWI